MTKTYQLGLHGRHRDVDGRISEKHGNTRVDTLRETYVWRPEIETWQTRDHRIFLAHIR